MAGALSSARVRLTRRFTAQAESWPHPDFPPEIYQIVISALRVAWTRVVAGVEPGEVQDWSEPETTSLIEDELNRMRDEREADHGFSGAIFQNVGRDSSVASYDPRQHIEKAPDLSFRLCGARPGLEDLQHKAIYAEAKIIDTTTSWLKKYSEKGVLRFVEGEYAWAMPSALMLGYARDGARPELHLAPYLAANSEALKLNLIGSPSLRLDLDADVLESRHSRTWLYPETERQPGDIVLLHLWL